MTTIRAEVTERDVAFVLDHRFGDGLVYLLHADERPVLEHAIRRGLVTPEGFMTPSGYRLWRRVDPAGALSGRSESWHATVC
jgi:hypothetical protein